MTTTDTEALTERIAKPIEQELCSRWMDTDDFAEEWVDPGRPQRLMFCDEHDTITRPGDRCPEAIRIATAVLPIVEAEVRAAKVEALREAVEKHAITIPDALGYKVPAVTVEDLLDAATEYETGDQR